MRFPVLVCLFASVTAMHALAQQPCAAPAQWTPCDFVFDAPAGSENLQLHGEFRSPRHKTFLIPAFWDGGNRYVVRISPTEPGEWNFRFTSSNNAWNMKQGTFIAEKGEAAQFIKNINVHHWQTVQDLQPHLWMGDAVDRIGYLPKAELDRILDDRAVNNFTHIRAMLLGEAADQSHAWSSSDGKPNPTYFQELDKRLLAVNQKGMVVDLVLADHPDAVRKLFPTWQDRERFIQYVTSRYAGYNITWQMVRTFEDQLEGRAITKELGTLIKKHDQYDHPKSSGAAVTSSPLLGDQWMNYITSNNAGIELGSVEHQLYTLPFVNAVSGKTVDEQRRNLWNSSMNGAYPMRSGGPEEATKQWRIWQQFFAGTRYWELEPYFYLDGGRAVALVREFGDTDEAVEYVVYVEKFTGPLEVQVKRHGYDARWFDPATGESIPIKDFKSERFLGEPPTKDHDWVLHISREGKKEGMLKSYKFESRPIQLQEVESQPKFVTFDIVEPAANDLSASKEIRFEAKVKRDTRGTRRMFYVWTGEVVPEGQGFRVLGYGKSGTFRIPKDIVTKYPGVLSLRLSAINANGKIYSIDKIYKLVP